MPARGRALLDAPSDRPLVVVVGGSLGAEALNRVVRDALGGLLDFATLAHVCGPNRTDTALSGRAEISPVRVCRRGVGKRSAGRGRCRRQPLPAPTRCTNSSRCAKPHLLVPLPSWREAAAIRSSNAGYASAHGWSRGRRRGRPSTRCASKREIRGDRRRSRPVRQSALEGAGLGDGTAAAADVIGRFARAVGARRDSGTAAKYDAGTGRASVATPQSRASLSSTFDSS